MAYYFLGERLYRYELFAMAVCFAAVVVIALQTRKSLSTPDDSISDDSELAEEAGAPDDSKST